MNLPHSTPETILDLAEASLGTPRETQRLCLELVNQLEHVPALWGKAFYLLGFSSRLLGELSDAEAALLRAKGIAQKIEDRKLIGSCAMQLGLLYLEQKKHERAVTMLGIAVVHLEHTGPAEQEAKARFTLANAQWALRDEPAALRNLDKALLSFSSLGSKSGVTAVQCGLANIDIDRARYPQAVERLELCLRILPQDSHLKNRIFIQLKLAECMLKMRSLSRAKDILDSAIASANRAEYRVLEAQGLMLYHDVEIAGGEAESAEAAKRRAIQLAEDHGFLTALELE